MQTQSLDGFEREWVLSELAVYGDEIAERCDRQLYKTDWRSAATADMMLGCTRAAYVAIRNGRDVLDVLYELVDNAVEYGAHEAPLDLLIVRIELMQG